MSLDMTMPRLAGPDGTTARVTTVRGSTVPDRTLRRADALLAGALLLVIVWRWGLVTAVPGPIGVDGGNWLRLAQAGLGRIDIDDVLTPPVVPLLAGVLDALFGPLPTVRLLAVLGSIAPSAGVWWTVRQRRHDLVAVLAAVSLALVTPTAAATAWGGVPQLLGLGLLPMAVVTIALAARTGTGRAWLRAGTLVALVGLTSTLITVLAAIGCAVALAHEVLRGRAGALRPVLAGLVPLTPVAALYGVILSRMSLPEGRLTARTGMEALRAGLGDPFALWMGLCVLVLAGAALRRRVDDDAALVAGLVGASVAGLLLGDTRFTAAVPTAIVVGVVLLPRPLARVRSLAVAGLLALTGPGIAGQATQVGFYAQFTPPTILDDAAAIALLVTDGEVVAAPPVAGAPTGWWLEALGIETAVASRSDWLSFPREREVAARVVALFTAPRWPTPLTAATACDEGFRALYVPDVWGGVDRVALAREVEVGRLRIVAELPGGLLLRSTEC